jgi:taurine dioxygenase
MAGIEVIPAGPACGAEVRCGPVQALGATAFAAIRHAWNEHLVLVFRDQRLDDTALAAFASRFGTPMSECAFVPGAPDRPAVHLVANGLEAEAAVGLYGAGAVDWHCDMTGFDAPPATLLLHALEVPPAGGETYFMNMYRAFETLPEDLRTRIVGLQLKHAVARDTAGSGDGPEHPLVITHPETGCNALYLGSRGNTFVVDLPPAASAALLDALWRHVIQWQFIWKHAWRPGDLLVWDNRCLLHARAGFDPAARRVLHRMQAGPARPALATDALARPPHARRTAPA